MKLFIEFDLDRADVRRSKQKTSGEARIAPALNCVLFKMAWDLKVRLERGEALGPGPHRIENREGDQIGQWEYR